MTTQQPPEAPGESAAAVAVNSMAARMIDTWFPCREVDRAVGPEKREHIERVARYFARQAGVDWGRARFDIVNVLLTSTPRIELLRDAFRSGRTL